MTTSPVPDIFLLTETATSDSSSSSNEEERQTTPDSTQEQSPPHENEHLLSRPSSPANESLPNANESLLWTPTSPLNDSFSAKVDVELDDEQPAELSSSPSSTSPHTSPAESYFILEEILSTSALPDRILRPATVRAVFLSESAAFREMKKLVYECADPPAARVVRLENVFKDGVYMGKGYEYHTRSLKLRTLWIQEGLRGHFESSEESEESEE